MSYYKLKRISIKGNSVIAELSPNNISPQIWFKADIDGKNLGDRLYSLYGDICRGDIHPYPSANKSSFVKAAESARKTLNKSQFNPNSCNPFTSDDWDDPDTFRKERAKSFRVWAKTLLGGFIKEGKRLDELYGEIDKFVKNENEKRESQHGSPLF